MTETANLTPEFTDAQDYFDKTLTHIRAQTRRCAINIGLCLYDRDIDEGEPPENCNCAIGKWLPASYKARSRDWETSLNVRDLAKSCPELEGVAWPVFTTTRHGEQMSGLDLAAELQRLHDNEYSRTGGSFDEGGETIARAIAERFNLTYTPPADSV